MLAPIVIFVYNRPEHAQKLIDSLSKNELARQSQLFIFSDAAKNEANTESVAAVRKYIQGDEIQKRFQKVTVKYAESNNGLAKSVISGVSEVIEQYGKAIVLEDDLIVSSQFLKFMNMCLDKYENDERIFSVSGFSRDIEFLRSMDLDMYFSCRAQSWGWATWKNRWESVDWDVKDYKEFKHNFSERRAFNAGGNDMSSMLDRQQCGKINSWAIRFCYAQFRNHAYTVQPRVTLVQNSGQDGSGTNCSYVREFSDLSQQAQWKLREFNEDQDINIALKQTRKHIPIWKLIGSYAVFVIFKGKFIGIN